MIRINLVFLNTHGRQAHPSTHTADTGTPNARVQPGLSAESAVCGALVWNGVSKLCK